MTGFNIKLLPELKTFIDVVFASFPILPTDTSSKVRRENDERTSRKGINLLLQDRGTKVSEVGLSEAKLTELGKFLAHREVDIQKHRSPVS